MMRKSLDSRVLKQRVDLVALVSGFTNLRRTGRELVGLCPLHLERHPSFYVNPEKQVFHCFGCGAGGDVFAFVMRAVGCNFRHALEIVEEFVRGVALASDPRSGSRFGVGEGAEPLRPPKAGCCNSQSLASARALILAQLDATERRLAAIRKANRDAAVLLATACEPPIDDENDSLLVKNRITLQRGRK
jgi:CHC2 zinc finger